MLVCLVSFLSFGFFVGLFSFFWPFGLGEGPLLYSLFGFFCLLVGNFEGWLDGFGGNSNFLCWLFCF